MQLTVDSRCRYRWAICCEATRPGLQNDLTLGLSEPKTLPEHRQRPFTRPASTVASEAGLDSVKKIPDHGMALWELYRTAPSSLAQYRHVG